MGRTSHINNRKLTLFTWGYWGWGNSTRELVQAIDAAEKRRGFRPPIFVDIRLRRSVRAKGFCGNAFAQTVGDRRYKHIPELGNLNVKLNKPGIRIAEPEAAGDLLQLAMHYQRQKRRVLFFCACKDLEVRRCHRSKVAKLVLEHAARRHYRAEIVEWPGDKPRQTKVALTVSPAILKAVIRGRKKGRKNVPLGRNSSLHEFAGLPWGSVVNLQAEDSVLPIATGPAKYLDQWRLPVLRYGKIGDGPNELKQWAVGFRERKGLEPRYC